MRRSNHFWLWVRNYVSWRLSQTFGVNLLTLYPKSKAPYNVTIYKGSNQAALTRAFVLYFLHRYLNNTLHLLFASSLTDSVLFALYTVGLCDQTNTAIYIWTALLSFFPILPSLMKDSNRQ